MENGGVKGMGRIEKVVLYHCGFCVNNLALIFRKMPWKSRRFPALAVLIQHKTLGNILYDTGYSEHIVNKGMQKKAGLWERIVLKLYGLLNPVSVERDDMIDKKLGQDGIDSESVNTIILSHGHPDHVGGLSRFSGYELVTSEEVMEAIRKPKTGGLVFSSQIPEIKESKVRQMSGQGMKEHFLCRYFDRIYDLFGDGSVIGVILDGHCKGQMGIWIPDVSLFFAADACWGKDLVHVVGRMRFVPRMIQENFKDYQDTLGRIVWMKKENPEIQVVFSHQTGRERVYEGAD